MSKNNGGPDYQFYNGKGYGYLQYHGGLISGYDWLDGHYRKYPQGKLPEQKITITRRKK